jgi:hypothetical protein
MLLVYGLLTLYALEIVVPLLALAIAFVTRRARRAGTLRAASGTVPIRGQSLPFPVRDSPSGLSRKPDRTR